MALIAIHQPDAPSRARLVSALGSAHETVCFPDWRSAREGLDHRPFGALVLDLHDPVEAVGTAEVELVRKQHQALAIIACSDFRGREMELFTLGRLGVDGVIPAEDVLASAECLEIVGEALTNSLASRVAAAVTPRMQGMGVQCLRWAVENSHRNPTVEDLASAFTSSQRLMVRVLRQEGSPAPGRLLLWGRLLRASQRLADGRVSVERAAYLVGYSSGAALSRAMRRATGHSPEAVRRRGGVGFVLDAFVRRELKPVTPRRRSRWRSPLRMVAVDPRRGGSS